MKEKIVYGAGEGYPSTGAVAGCKASMSSSNRGHPGVGRQAPGRVHASGEDDTRNGGARRGPEEPDVMNIGTGTSRVRRSGGTVAAAGGRGSDNEMPNEMIRNAVVFSFSGRCGRARQAVIPQDCQAR